MNDEKELIENITELRNKRIKDAGEEIKAILEKYSVAIVPEVSIVGNQIIPNLRIVPRD